MTSTWREGMILAVTLAAVALICALLPSGATRWMPEVERAAKAAGVPAPLFHALVRQESGFRHWVVSRKGAIGLAQLMPATARGLGVNPYDPRANLRGGAIYLRRMLDRFGDVRTALMAYNWGPGRVQAWIRRGRDPAKVPAETRAYLAGIKPMAVSQDARPGRNPGSAGILPASPVAQAEGENLRRSRADAGETPALPARNFRTGG